VSGFLSDIVNGDPTLEKSGSLFRKGQCGLEMPGRNTFSNANGLAIADHIVSYPTNLIHVIHRGVVYSTRHKIIPGMFRA
jgi:hypothetical protein